MYYLRDFPNHLKAFEYMQQQSEKLNSDIHILDDFFYILKLTGLEADAVKVFYDWQMQEIFPAFDPNLGSIFLIFLMPDTDDEASKLTGDEPMCWWCLNIDLPTIHPKQDASKYCGVTARQTERWMAGDHKREKLPHFHHGKDRIFLEYDLWRFMTNYRVGERRKYRNEYTPYENIEFREK